jgi:outer membrane protein assembly factor BamB
VWSDCEPTDSLIKSCVKLAAGMIATPAVDPATGNIYVATSRYKDSSGTGSPSDRGVVYKISPTGTILWSWSPARAGYGFDSSPALWPASNPDALYIGGRDGTATPGLGYLHKLNPSTGALIWEYQVPTSLPGLAGNPRASISNTPAVEQEGSNRYIYFSTEYGAGMKLRDGAPPTLQWGVWLGMDINTQASPPGPGPNVRRMVHGSPGLTSDFVYFGVVTDWDKECAFQAVRKSDGVIFQSFVMNNDTHSTLRVAPNNWLYYASCDNYTYGVDTNPEALDSRLIR